MYNYSDYLNKEYTTHAWSKRFLNGMDVQALHVAFTTKGIIFYLQLQLKETDSERQKVKKLENYSDTKPFLMEETLTKHMIYTVSTYLQV